MAAPPVRPSRRPGLLGYFVRHGTAANLLMALMMLFGLYGAQNLNLQLTPDIASNQVAVNVVWEGAGPEHNVSSLGTNGRASTRPACTAVSCVRWIVFC